MLCLHFLVSLTVRAPFWVIHNNCDPHPRMERIDDEEMDDDMRVRIQTYGHGGAGSEVRLVAVEGGGHTWPGGLQYMPEWLIGRTCRAFNASAHIWAFCRRFHRATG